MIYKDYLQKTLESKQVHKKKPYTRDFQKIQYKP